VPDPADVAESFTVVERHRIWGESVGAAWWELRKSGMSAANATRLIETRFCTPWIVNYEDED
jgi:hypothetical protein